MQAFTEIYAHPGLTYKTAVEFLKSYIEILVCFVVVVVVVIVAFKIWS